MHGYQERIQGADRVLRIRRIRKVVFAGLLALTVVPVKASSTEVVSFTSPDPLGLTFVTQAVVSATAGNFSVSVVRNNVTVITKLLSGPNAVPLDIEPTMWAAYANWSIVFRNRDPFLGYVRFVLQKGVVPTLFSTVPFLVFLYAAAQVGWWVLLRPIRERTRESSRHAIRELESGERFYDPAMSATEGAPVETPETVSKSWTSPPPPPPARPDPPPRPSPAPAP